MLGEKQREYFEDHRKERLHIFTLDHLGEEVTLHHSTVYRLLRYRIVEALSCEHAQCILPAKDLLVTQDTFQRYAALPHLNARLIEEFNLKRAFSDEELLQGYFHLARRTVSKYRDVNDVPKSTLRTKLYQTGERTEPYVLH